MGTLFDAGTDFLLVFGVSATLYLHGTLSVWFLALILIAFAQFAMRPQVESDPLGRHIGTVLFVALGIVLIVQNSLVTLCVSIVASAYIVASLSLRWLPRRSSS